MPAAQEPQLDADKKQRLLGVFERLLPLIDALADKLRLVICLGVLVSVWLAVWMFFLKQFSLGTSLAIAATSLLPTLILSKFWWSLDELKDLPKIADRMADDAKAEFKASLQTIRLENVPKLSFIGAGKKLWSIGGMVGEVREIVGSYLSLSTLLNPFMLILGTIAFVSVFLLFFVGIVLAFFV